jgi:DNA topoisomerase VI subunit B
MKGLESRQRINEKLYLDYRLDKSKANKRMTIEEMKTDQVEETTPAALVEEEKKNAVYYRVTVKDNGCGMEHDDIPNMFGRGTILG